MVSRKRKKKLGGHRAYVKKVISRATEEIDDVGTVPNESERRQLTQSKAILREKLNTLIELNNQILELLCSKENKSDEIIATETEAEMNRVIRKRLKFLNMQNCRNWK